MHTDSNNILLGGFDLSPLNSPNRESKTHNNRWCHPFNSNMAEQRVISVSQLKCSDSQYPKSQTPDCGSVYRPLWPRTADRRGDVAGAATRGAEALCTSAAHGQSARVRQTAHETHWPPQHQHQRLLWPYILLTLIGISRVLSYVYSITAFCAYS